MTARIVSDHITLAANQADGWDVKFERGNEVRFLAVIFYTLLCFLRQQLSNQHIWNNNNIYTCMGFALGISLGNPIVPNGIPNENKLLKCRAPHPCELLTIPVFTYCVIVNCCRVGNHDPYLYVCIGSQRHHC